jgi:hypothetical protein
LSLPITLLLAIAAIIAIRIEAESLWLDNRSGAIVE